MLLCQILKFLWKNVAITNEGTLVCKKRKKKFSAFLWKSVVKSSLWYSGGMTGIFFSFRKFMNKNQYALELFWTLCNILAILDK